MEVLSQAYGFIAYRYYRPLPPGPLSFSLACADRCHIIVNGRTRKIIYNTEVEAGTAQFSLSLEDPSNDVIILAENLGRVNYDMAPKRLDGELKGATGYLSTAYESILSGYRVYSLPLDTAQMALLGQSSRWQSIEGTPDQTQPTFYQFALSDANISPQSVANTPYLDLQAWTKGVAFLNGFNLGRYWISMGPTKTLYYPPAIINSFSTNVMTLFELDGAGDAVSMVGVPNYGQSCNMPCFWNNALD